MRQSFDYDGTTFNHATLVIHHDEDAEVFVNGEKVWSRAKWNDQYVAFDVTKKVRKAMRKGRNVIAVHVRQDFGGQYIDLALLLAAAESKRP